VDALTIRVSGKRFWRLSLRELWNEYAAAVKRSRRDYERDLILAWQVQRMEIMSMTKDGGRKLPDLRKLLDTTTGSQRQTPEEQFAIVHAIGASLGVGVQRMRKGDDGQYRRID